eukprot:529284-Rhodomonas_salina.1
MGIHVWFEIQANCGGGDGTSRSSSALSLSRDPMQTFRAGVKGSAQPAARIRTRNQDQTRETQHARKQQASMLHFCCAGVTTDRARCEQAPDGALKLRSA